MRRPVALPGDRLSPLATAGLDRWPFKTELGLQTPLTFAAAPASRARFFDKSRVKFPAYVETQQIGNRETRKENSKVVR